jgi:hypothetical protein
VVEYAFGTESYPLATEWLFYVFEAVPMLFAIAIFSLWFAPAYVPRHKFGDDVEAGKNERNATNGANTPVMRSSAPSRAPSVLEQSKPSSERYA